MRAFIAIDLSNEAKREIERNHYVIKENCSKSRITSIGNLHLTLKFLGEIDNHQFIIIKNIMNEVASSYEKFNLSLSNWGRFNSRKGSIIWLGVDGDTVILKYIAKQLSDGLSMIVNDQGLNFKPHITIARDSIISENIKNWKQPKSINWNINYIVLYESVFENTKVSYHERYKIKFGS